MSIVTLQLHKTDSEFLEKLAICVNIGENNWYMMPFWFEKISDGVFVQHSLDEIPDSLKEFINKNREHITDANNIKQRRQR